MSNLNFSIMSEITANTPKNYQRVGEVLNVDEKPSKFKDAVILEIDFIGADVQTVFVPSGYWLAANMSRWCMEGAFVRCIFEITKKDKTTYEDSDGMHYHEKDNDAKLGKISKASKRMISAAIAEDIESTGKYEDLSQAQATIISGILSK